jgi:glycosyltransferase involved in cell wall biosynthesis
VVAREDAWPWSEPQGTTSAIKKTVRNALYLRRWRSVFDSYDRCVANSEFTARWIAKRWGLAADVVYPPVRSRFDARPKEKLILSVGRFAPHGATRKRQLEMVQAFARTCESLPPGWEYACLGGLANDADDQRYFDEVQAAARGHPVRLMANPPAAVVKDAYERASIFWHAAGYGEDESVHPERTEHFGMSTVEAMSAGCVPVVIRKGGQPEIVEHGSSGYLWDTLDELVTLTRGLANDPDHRRRMSAAAEARAKKFTDTDDFAANMLRIVQTPGDRS